ncbi:prolyl oligopeptidase family serine peptidase [Bacillaceae bacterium IKA-2]|nr:prolyl oligopeptidase family serine peptidase [Bacillaceae bacterium IKA-2]
MIFRITYNSNEYKVKGYLGLPNHVAATRFKLARFFNEIKPIERVSYSIIPSSAHLETIKMPCIIYCRGGIGHFGRVKPNWVEAFANQGYLIFAPCYRGNEGGEGRDEFGGADKEDVDAAVRLLQTLPFVDKNKISIMGFSRGSINATQTAITMPTIDKLILWGGVSDLTQTYEERVDLRRMLKRVIGGTPRKFPDAYEARSPIQLASKISCPVLIIHGTKDAQVDISHGINMYSELKHLQKEVTLHSYNGYGHHLPLPVRLLAIKRMFDWITRKA